MVARLTVGHAHLHGVRSPLADDAHVRPERKGASMCSGGRLLPER
jgi:hypothetical protein